MVCKHRKAPSCQGIRNLEPSFCEATLLTAKLLLTLRGKYHKALLPKVIEVSFYGPFFSKSGFINKSWWRAKRSAGSSGGVQTERSLPDSVLSPLQQLSWTHGWCNFKYTFWSGSIQNAWHRTIQQNAFMESWASLLHSSCRASGWCLAALHEWLGYWPRFSNGISKISRKKNLFNMVLTDVCLW